MKHLICCMLVGTSWFVMPGCKSVQSSSLEALERQERRDELCGVEAYTKRQDKACGTIYLKKRSSRCGVSKYALKKNKKCKGYVAPKEYVAKRSSRFTCKEKGFYTADQWTRTRTVGSRNVDREVIDHYARCRRDEVIAKCRIPENGVAEWKSCRHKSHGIEAYKECRRPEHGVQTYKKCEFYKNPTQAVAFAERIEEDIPMMRDNLLIHQGNFYALQENEVALASLISQYHADPLYSEIVSDLILKFGSTFGKPYQPTLDNETSAMSIEEIESYTCAEDETSSVCRAAWGYQITKRWFTENISDLTLIKEEMISFKQTKIAETMETVAQSLLQALPETRPKPPLN